MIKQIPIILLVGFLLACNSQSLPTNDEKEFVVTQKDDQIQVFLKGQELALVTQNAKAD